MINKISRNMVENDLVGGWDSVKTKDYLTPSSFEIIKIIIKAISPLYVIHLITFAAYCYNLPDYRTWENALLLSLLSSVGISLVILAVSYLPVYLYLCISVEDKDRSIIIAIAIKKLKVFSVFLFAIVLVVSFPNALNDKDELSLFIPAISTFVVGLILSVCYRLSMARYLTPGAIKILKDISSFISGRA
jgi:hypothetical protein